MAQETQGYAAEQEAHLVRKQFEEQLRLYTTGISLAQESPAIPFLVEWVGKHEDVLRDRFPLRVCEFGGGGGILLGELGNRLGNKLALYNAELVETYRSHQASDRIHFVHTSVLDSGFASDDFDVVIVRNLLHHLVGKSLKQTRINQRRVIGELCRVAKPGGLVLIDEQVNRLSIACPIFYYLSRFSSRVGFRSKYFQITPYTVVGYLTQKALITMCEQHAPAPAWLANEYRRWKMALHWRLTGLMSDTGTAFIAMQKPSPTNSST